MGLEKIIEEVMRKGEAEASENLRKSQAEADAIIAKAQAEAKAYVDGSKAHAMEAGQRERVEELSKGKSEAKRIVADARKDVVERHLDAVWSEALKLRGGDTYRRLVLASAKEAAADLGEGCRFFVRREDIPLMGAYMGVEAADSAGGVLAEDSRGRIRIDSRLESLFSDRKDALGAVIYGELFKDDR